MRGVPAGIERPVYVGGGRDHPPALQVVTEPDDVARLRNASRVTAQVLAEAGSAVAAGVTTDEIDRVAHEAYIRLGAHPSTLGYGTYTKSICTSVNEVICHGIPDSRPLVDGDIVNVDVSAYVGGFHGDSSATFVVGDTIDPPTAALVDATRDALAVGIEAVRPGLPIRVIGVAIQRFARARGFGVVAAYGGHGIGRVFHAAPHVSHVDAGPLDLSASTMMVPGMTFTIEPMLTAGRPDHQMWPDGWTVVTTDGLPSAQFEHTVMVTDDGCDVLTISP